MQSSVPMSFVFPSATAAYGQQQQQQQPVVYPPVPPQLNPYAGMPMYAMQHQYYQPGPGGKVYMYQPNEIRHRKRTSRHQLQVLEAVFVDDQKPGPAIRKKLAVELSMTARSVQVWFQNRRAKDKNLQKKAALVAAQQNGQQDASVAASVCEPELADGGEGAGPAADVGAHAITDTDELASAHGESASPPPQHGESSAASPASQAGSEHTSRSASASLPRSSPDLAMLRRGSAPALMNDGATACGVHVPLGPPDAGRRQSLELSFARMQAHPYPSRLSVAPPSSFRRAQLGGNALDMQRAQQRRGSAPRVTPLAAPAVFHNSQAPSSGATNVNGSISSPAFSNNVAGWVNQTAANAAAHTHGFIRAPAPQHLPGPLPAKDFSFGAPPAPSSDLPRVGSEESIESPTGDAYSRSGSFASFVDGDLSRAPRFGSFASVSDSDPTHGTRFSSFASAAGSEASTSTYYSALPTPDGWAPDSRRSSFVEFTNTLSNLHVGAAPTGERLRKSTSPPQMDASLFSNFESSPASSNSSTGTMLYASSPPAPPTGISDQQAPSKGHHQSEMNYTLMSASVSVQEAPRQQYNPSNGYYDSSQVPNVQSSSSSSLSGAMGDSALGSTQMQTSSSTSNSLSTSSSSTSLSGLSTPLDMTHPYMGQQPGVVTPESAPVFHAPAPSEQMNFVDTSCFDPQNGFYPTVQVQPPSAGVGGMGLALEQAYPFFSA